MITPSRASEWFTPTNNRAVPTRPWSDPAPHPDHWTNDEPIAQSPAPCRHELDNENLRGWLSRLPGDATVTVDEVLMRLGRKVVA